MAGKKEVVEEVNVFKVFDSMGGLVREYTTEIHGKDAEKLASQFAEKIKGSVK